MEHLEIPGPMSAPPDDEDLFQLLYGELRRLAGAYMRRQGPGHTLQTTALVNEAWVRISGVDGFDSRAHFLGTAARAMRSALVDHARGKNRQKRRAEGVRIALEGLSDALRDQSIDILDLDSALDSLAALGEKSQRAARVVELRFFCGLTIPQIAGLIGVSEATVERDWEFARAWLRKKLA